MSPTPIARFECLNANLESILPAYCKLFSLNNDGISIFTIEEAIESLEYSNNDLLYSLNEPTLSIRSFFILF